MHDYYVVCTQQLFSYSRIDSLKLPGDGVSYSKTYTHLYMRALNYIIVHAHGTALVINPLISMHCCIAVGHMTTPIE